MKIDLTASDVIQLAALLRRVIDTGALELPREVDNELDGIRGILLNTLEKEVLGLHAQAPFSVGDDSVTVARDRPSVQPPPKLKVGQEIPILLGYEKDGSALTTRGRLVPTGDGFYTIHVMNWSDLEASVLKYGSSPAAERVPVIIYSHDDYVKVEGVLHRYSGDPVVYVDDAQWSAIAKYAANLEEVNRRTNQDNPTMTVPLNREIPVDVLEGERVVSSGRIGVITCSGPNADIPRVSIQASELDTMRVR